MYTFFFCKKNFSLVESWQKTLFFRPSLHAAPLTFVCVGLVSGVVHVDKRFGDIKAQLQRGEEVKGGMLTHMLTTMEMSLEEIYANVTEMLLAGVDTVGSR